MLLFDLMSVYQMYEGMFNGTTQVALVVCLVCKIFILGCTKTQN